MEQTINYYGVKEFTENQTDVDRHLEEFKMQGFTLLPEVLNQEELTMFREALDAVYAQQVDEIGGEANLELINDANLVRAPFCYDERFLKLPTHPRVLAIVEKLMGDNFTLMLENGIINRHDVKNFQRKWHRDLNYQHYVSSRPLSVSALYCIDRFAKETGGTIVLPASNKMESFPSQEYCKNHEVQVTADAGTVVIFDSMLWHRAGENTSDDVRRAINHMFVSPIIKQQVSFPQMLEGKYSDDPFLRKLMGYDFETPPSVKAWRERKLRCIEPLNR